MLSLLYYAPLGLFLALLGLYIWIQFLSTVYETRYFTVVVLLAGQFIFGVATVWLASGGLIGISMWVALPIALWSVITIILALVKTLVLGYQRLQPPKYITRARTEVGIEHKDIILKTQDGVEVAGFHINKGHSQLIILAHGGSRCKNSYENVGLAQWFSYDYDVISYDTRGHFESGGYWTADGKTKLDLIAVLDYANECGYKKIGLFGRSLGGWTGMLVAAERSDIASMIVVSAPLGHIRETPMVRSINRLKGPLGRIIVRASQGLRYHDYRDQDTLTPAEVAEKIRCPIFLIYGQQDEVLGLTEAKVHDVYRRIQSKKKVYFFPEVAHLPFPWHLGPIYRMGLEWFAETMC